MTDSRLIFKLSSILLQYPDGEWISSRELRDEIFALGDEEIRKLFSDFMAYIDRTDLADLCSEYVNTFDFNEKTTLYLTYLQYGDQRERGQALVDLKARFEQAGYQITSEELPDYLPLLLEFASVVPQSLAKEILESQCSILEKLHSELEMMNSPYARVLQACLLSTGHSVQKDVAGGAS
ncbi:nitrate reductase molybdenum cofactor assembly chaperone [Microaerobacter geothermalis]|uniref:nitrate reductase molybdenum cofactor assembly chaperone n=1 Tax=Microaerobacter geothermalis TaxID=674972 RepID=UPI001F242538|nr:nitrate reductase molybdenum cofactor assembly chaperone [Microaerobacter geothermalis]MCF6094464.1 nitrate reductase molybdenum cofactor assembly chaperone [Microaerobacter geothermalis]